MTASRTVADNWQALQDVLLTYGFDRLLYGKKMRAERANLHNHSNTLLLSSYGHELDKLFLESRLYMNSPTVIWAMTHYGAISWATTTQRKEQGDLSAVEDDVRLITRDLGLTAGLTYSIPSHTEEFRSSLGLAHQGTQADADAVWAEHQADLEAIICVFDISIQHYVNVPEGQHLDPRTLTFMELLAEGRSQSEIAELEGCHFRTVDSRLAKARAILGAANTLEAVLLAKIQGQL